MKHMGKEALLALTVVLLLLGYGIRTTLEIISYKQEMKKNGTTEGITIISRDCSPIIKSVVEKGCRCEACDMRFEQENMTTVNGLRNKDYFCIWTRGRTPEDITETTFHEVAHYYARTNATHFSTQR